MTPAPDPYALPALRAAAEQPRRTALAVSAWSVGMHVHHCCLAMIGICNALRDSTPPPPVTLGDLARRPLLWIGRIPRGRAQAPARVRPQRGISAAELADVLTRAETMLAEAPRLDPGTWFRHFAFGVLSRDRALRFIGIHNRHHLRIIADIQARAR